MSEKIEKLHVDDVLSKFRLFGCYHRQVIFLSALAYAFNAICNTNYIFAAEEVAYRCNDGSFANNTCGTNSTASCSEWVYDVPNSFVADFQLACQDWKRTLVGTAHNLGYTVGLFFVGTFSDRIGRKAMIILTFIAAGVLGLVKSFATWYWLYIALEFLEAAFGNSYTPLYILNIEMVSKTKRVPFTTYCGLGYCIGGIFQALAAYLANDWRIYLRVIYTPILLIVFYMYVIDESPRWLLLKGKQEQAIAVLRKMAKKNNLKIESNVLDNLINKESNEQHEKFLSVLKQSFKSTTLLKRLMVCLVWWMTSCFVDYGMMITSVFLQGNKYFNYALISLIDVPANLLVMYVIIKFNRKMPLIGSFLIAGVFCIGQPFIPTNHQWMSVIIYLAGKTMVVFYFGITYFYTSEIFPTYIRNSMVGLCSASGRIGGILASQLPLLTVYWVGLPSLIYGITSIVAGLLTFLVPDVANDALPDTVEEAENIGIRDDENNIEDKCN